MELYRLTIPDCPPSMNRAGGHSHWRKWQQLKKQWQGEMVRQLEYVELPKDLGAVTASAQLRFPDRRRRDSDNFTPLLAKSLGDALQVGGWLQDDTPEFFQFEPVCFAVAPRQPKRTTVLLVQGVQPSMFTGAWDEEAA